MKSNDIENSFKSWMAGNYKKMSMQQISNMSQLYYDLFKEVPKWKKSWKITLSDGTQLKDLKLSGNNYISKTKITEDDFKGKLSKITIENETDKTSEELEHMELVQIVHYEDGYYFVLRQLSADEIDKIKTKADIEYLAMMTDVDLEEV